MTNQTILNLDNILNNAVYRIPNYQRGYSWETEQIKELITDITNIIKWNEQQSRTNLPHFMGTIITQQTNQTQFYHTTEKPIIEIVDGQQRLISLSLYLSAILSKLIQTTTDKDEIEKYKDAIKTYLYWSGKTHIKLHDTIDNEFYLDLLKNGGETRDTNPDPVSFTETRLSNAGRIFGDYVNNLSVSELNTLYTTITTKLSFCSYKINESCEIGITFELVNNRGKQLTNFELLKNYLLYWISYNITDPHEKEELSLQINNTWKAVYENINYVKANDTLTDDFLRYVYILESGNTTYDGYKNFKTHIPATDSTAISKLQSLLLKLKAYSQHYKSILLPNSNNATEYEWLTNLHHTQHISNFMPLLLVCRSKYKNKEITPELYAAILQAIEHFIYRVYMIAGYRSDTHKAVFYKQAINVQPDKLVEFINKQSEELYPFSTFSSFIQTPQDWYQRKTNALKYTLFEYEKNLVTQRDQTSSSLLNWDDIASPSTLEHILPQTLTAYWVMGWNDADIETWKHDIGNLMLTKDNSRYSNKPYHRKCRGEDGDGNVVEQYYYGNSNICQERQMTKYKEWSVTEAEQRHKEIADFILQRWA